MRGNFPCAIGEKRENSQHPPQHQLQFSGTSRTGRVCLRCCSLVSEHRITGTKYSKIVQLNQELYLIEGWKNVSYMVDLKYYKIKKKF